MEIVTHSILGRETSKWSFANFLQAEVMLQLIFHFS